MPQFNVGDAKLNRWAVQNGTKVNTDYGKRAKEEVYNSSAIIHKFLQSYSNIQVHYSHDKKDL